MTEAAWVVTALTGIVIALMGLVLKDTRDRQDRSDRRSDRMEDAMEKEQTNSTAIRLSGFERLAAMEAIMPDIRSTVAALRTEMREALAETRTEMRQELAASRAENRARHDRADGRFDQLEGLIRRNGGGH